MKKKIILSALIVIIISSFLVFNFFKEDSEVYENIDNSTVINKNNFLAIMYENEEGEYVEATDNNWKTTGYIFNTELSKCSKGSKIYWDSTNNKVVVEAVHEDRCYAYFKKPTFADKVLLTYGTDTTLIKHDGTHTAEVSGVTKVVDANDNSYRYSGEPSNVNNNYVCLDTKTSGTCDSDKTYRILGLFKNKQNKYEVKLIKNSKLNSSTFSWTEESTNIWSELNLNKITLNGTDSGSFLMSLGSYAELIEEHEYKTGGFDTKTDKYVRDIYDDEILHSGENGTHIPPQYGSKVTKSKIGLMYMSDYLYGTTVENWTSAINGFSYPSSRYDWLTPLSESSNEIFITRASYDTYSL